MKIAIAVMLFLTAGICFAGNVAAQSSTRSAEEQNGQRSPVKKIGFRLPKWETLHGDTTQTTQDTIATLQEIGCEVQESNHGNHVDIKFRCANWKAIVVETDAQADQWQAWLANYQFETVVVNPPASTQSPKVELRLVDWKAVHAESRTQADSIKQTYEVIGCEVQIDNHGNHVDVRIRCPQWTTIGLPNAKTAHVWQDWLNKSGFETKHDHTAGHDAHAGHDHEGHDHGHQH